MELAFSQFLYPVRSAQTEYCPELYIAPWKEGILDMLGQEGYRVFLPPEEKTRAQKFSNDAERNRFIAARLLLRCLLSQKSSYCVHPSSWKFRSGPNGKPYLSGPPFWENSSAPAATEHQGKPVFPQFNLSHSGDYIALAFSECANLGVDIELMKTRRDIKGIARLIFTPDENQILQEQLKKNSKNAEQYFYRLWCRHEALGKLEGGGLFHQPQNAKSPNNLRNFANFQDFISMEGNFRCPNNRHSDNYGNSHDLYFWALCWRAHAKYPGRLCVQ